MTMVDSSLVPQPPKRKQTAGRDYVPLALAFGVPAAILLILALVADSVIGSGVRSIPVLGAVWSVLFFMVVTICVCILVPCGAILGWRVCKTLEGHEREKVAFKHETAVKKGELQLLSERVTAARLANESARMAMLAGDNYTITSGHDSVSTQIVRAAVLLEQSRIQYAARASVASAEKKQLGPPSDPNKKYHPPVDTGGIMTFAALLVAGLVAEAVKEGFILLGYVDGLLRYGTWEDLYSCGIGGVSGSGKTTTVRFILFQAILAGARLLMIDPHIHDVTESLAAQFSMFKDIHIMKPCDDNLEAVMKRIRWMMAEYTRRKAKGIKGPPLVFVIDEFNEIVRLLPVDARKELAELLMYISQGGRKFGLYAMLIGQRWSEQDLGGKPHGASIRSSLASLLVHRFTDPQQAAKLVVASKVEQCTELEQGHFFFRDTQGKCSYTITPFTTSSDGTEIQRLLDELESTDESTEKRSESSLGGVLSKDTGPLPRARSIIESNLVPSESRVSGAESTDIHTLALKIIEMQAVGTQKNEIMRSLWGVNPGNTEAYKKANLEYQAVMQYIAERLGSFNL